jgi:signal transduction protein with GAF and PtsI domain
MKDLQPLRERPEALDKTAEMPHFRSQAERPEEMEKTAEMPRFRTQAERPEALEETQELPRFRTTAERSEEEFRIGQSRILEMIAANAPLSEILDKLVLLIEAQVPNMFCSVLLLSEDGDHIRHAAAPSLPEDYVKGINGGSIGPKHGSCGTAMYRGEPVIVSDILSDPLWEDYRELAKTSGMRACWSTPILSGNRKVLGSFAMYYREPRTPTGEESSLTEVATRIAGLAIERQAAKEILARTQAQLAQATQAAATGEAAASIAHEVNQQLEAIVDEAKLGVDQLNEDKPDLVQLRQSFKNILSHGRNAIESMGRIQSAPRK